VVCIKIGGEMNQAILRATIRQLKKRRLEKKITVLKDENE